MEFAEYFDNDMIINNIKNELLKILGFKYLLIFLSVLITINFVLCLYYTRIDKNALPQDSAAELFELYLSEPETLTAEYDTLQAYQAEQNMLWQEQMRLGNYDFQPDSLANKYAPENHTDIELFDEVFNRINAIQTYASNIQNVIDRAAANLAEFDSMGISPETYIYQYQMHVINIYINAQTNVRMGLEYTRGWGEYFAYDIVNVLIFAVLIMVGAVIFAQEKISGFMPIIRVSKHGLTKTALAKIAAMMIVSTVIVIAFTAETWLIFGLRLGYSSPFNAIQVFDEFTLCPYVISVGEYFAITIAVKFAIFMLFATVIMAISVFVYNYAVIYILGLGFYGFNFLLYTLDYINADNPLKNLNLVAIAEVNPLFARYRAINIFGNVVDYIPFMCVVFTALLIVMVVLTVWKYNCGAETVNVRWVPEIISKINGYFVKLKRNQTKAKRNRSYSISLFGVETYKTFIASRFILIFLALLLVKGYISYVEYQPQKSYSDTVYKEYMTKLAGETTDDKRQYLADERAMINETLAKQQSMQESYVNEEITFDEYRSYLTDYNYAYSRNEYLTDIENHAAYIDAKAEDGYETWFVYDTGWKTLLFTEFDWTIYAVLLLLFSGILANEYDNRSSAGGFVQILRSSKYGRERTFRAKLLSSTVITTATAIVWNLLDLVLITQVFDMPLINAPLQSMEVFGETGLTITIGCYLALFYVMRILAAITLTILICTLSEILRKNIITMAVTVMLTLFPALFSYFGLGVFSYVDFTVLMRVTPLILLGKIIFVLFSVSAVVISFVLTIYAERKWDK